MATKFRDRFSDGIPATGLDTNPAGADGGGVVALRAEANHFLRVGDDVINRTLSTDSEAHNRSGKQDSGQ
jgi:hypothetical protein